MLKLVLCVVVETILGLAAAGVVLAVALPLMIGRRLIIPGDSAGSILIAAVLVCAVGGMLLRPGSAINRYGKPGR